MNRLGWIAVATASMLLALAPSADAQDLDGDGVLDAADNCPFVANGPGEALGQPVWGNQAESSQYLGVGCACLCGDANRDCLINAADAPEAQRAGLTPPLPPLSPFFNEAFCDLNSDGACNVGDAPEMQRAGLVPPLPPISPDFDVRGCSGYRPGCEALEGNANGLCTAYCEATDCAVLNLASCDELRDNFLAETGNPLFPCDACETCLELEEAGFELDCDVFDDGLANGSCPQLAAEARASAEDLEVCAEAGS